MKSPARMTGGGGRCEEEEEEDAWWTCSLRNESRSFPCSLRRVERRAPFLGSAS